MSDDLENSSELHDVVIIGGGPCGLAVACRLSEHMPAASFTDEEHQRYHWIRKHTGKMSIKNYKTHAAIPPQQTINAKLDMVVLDTSGDRWMARWDTLFARFGIDHLRSPMFFHFDPLQRDGLLAYAHMSGRGNELKEIGGCVGKEVSKHQRKKREKLRRQPDVHPNIDERDRNDYFVPSTRLFASHCGCLIDRYALREDVVRQEEVLDIRYDYFDHIHSTDKVFAIQTNKGMHYSRTAVLAVGPANGPEIPGMLPGEPTDAITHAMQITEMPSQRVRNKIAAKATTNVLIVGGGLTSAQLADLALRRGVTKVWLIMRGPLKVKPFDIGLEWVGKFRNFEQAAFWSSDTDEERWEKYRTARGGGSITMPYKKIVERHVAKGKLELCLHTTLSSYRWDSASQTWHVELSRPEQDQNQDIPPFDHIYFAIGIQTDFETLPYLKSLQEQYPVKNCGGFPCITEDMKWRDDVPLFVAGRLAGLQLGPGAPNLIGARIGAERIAWSVQDLLDESRPVSKKDGADEKFNYLTGRGSMFEALTAVAT
ncbi:FAD binding domain-containing protein [Pseudomassariella vexata]|uniref:L-ornithine N(5)-monooxygenase [NAD(P)H] n=1 Tax=Pseudomassariella vexata TaxID=1141098 RepID=A0A1Y2E0C9_9PEZI|nr:FAD binding domain-containing protein [Pseudomassariella vexata]ORY64806.1 FAD binding domain-containing protein [Pseudomassariella vexata]